MAKGFEQFFPGRIIQIEIWGIIILINKTIDPAVLTIPVWINMGISGPALGIIPTPVQVGSGIVLDDEVVPISYP
jgi:hypothetical protein